MVKDKHLYEQALNKYGREKQIKQLVEENSELITELSELNKSIMKHDKVDFDMIFRIAEEMADVTIMLNQFDDRFSRAFKTYKEMKLKRLDKRLRKMEK